MGGLIIWGVDARKGDDDVDCAQVVQPIAQIERFHSMAQTLVGQLLMPRHEAISVEAISSQRSHGSGYLLVHIQRSERRPHRSEASGDKQYYKRAGDSSIPMEHFDIEDAFNRVSPPSLDLGWYLRLAGGMMSGGEKTTRFQVILTLFNPSRITARFPYLNVREGIGAVTEALPSGVQDLRLGSYAGWACYSGGADHVVHPGQAMSMAMFVAKYSITAQGIETINSRPVSEAEVAFEYQHGCENARMQEGQFTISAAELLDGMRAVGFSRFS